MVAPQPRASVVGTGVETVRYALLGAAFGVCFPLVATILDATSRLGRAWPQDLWLAQRSNPLHWTIDTAPFFLGLFASFAGARQDRLREAYGKLVRSQEVLRKANEELAASAKLKSQFLANMSHELRTPLNAIIGFSRIMLRKVADKLDVVQYNNLKLISQSGQQLLQLVNDLLDFERIEAGSLAFNVTEVDCEEIAMGLRATLGPEAEKKGLSLEVSIVGPPIRLRTDPTRLRQVLINLVQNAIKYSDRGRVHLEIRRHPEQQPTELRLSVSDEGIGIPEDALGRIFEPFQQVDASSTRSHSGAGLGLAIVKRLVTMLGGNIEVDSQPGQGSTFTVSFPAASLLDVRLQVGELPELAPVGIGPLVLVVDDQVHVLEMIRMELADGGYRVHVAASGAEGLAKAKQLLPDVIVLDIIMPGVDGWQVLRGLRRDPTTSSIPVVISSILGDQPVGVDLGVAWLNKPFSADEFRAVMNRILVAGRDDVLVVEDDEATRGMLSQELQELECRVRTAVDGPAALAALEDRVPHVMILDLMLPGIDGFEVLRRLRTFSVGAETAVVVYTAMDLSPAERERLNHGLVEVVLKQQGLATRQVTEAVRRAVARRK